MSNDDGLRRKPKQARSLATFNHILDVAAELYATEGYENVSTNHIAKAAEVSVGSLYRFFPNKDAIVAALVDRYLEMMAASLPEEIDPTQPKKIVVRQLITGMVHFGDQHPMFHQIMIASQAGQVAQAGTRMHTILRTWIADMLGVYHPMLTAEQRYLCAAAGIGIVKGMLTLTEPPESLPFETVIDETIATLMAYVDDFVIRMET